MKCIRTVFTIVAACLIATACTSSSDAPGALEDPTPAATASVEAAPTATPPPALVVSDDELTAAAVAQLDADIDAGQGPEGMIAYDLMDSRVSDAGDVTLTVCAWNGDSAFDQVRDSLFRTTVDDGGSVSAQHVDSPIAQGDCLNTTLIETALDVANQYDAYVTEVQGDPQLSDSNTIAQIAEPLVAEAFTDQAQTWLEDNVNFPHARVVGPLEETVVTDILWRRYRFEDTTLLEFAFCRDMDPERGMYRDGVLLNDGSSPEDPRLHSVDAYQLAATQNGVNQWVVAGGESLIWSDCFATGDWPGAANVWRERTEKFERLPQ